MLTRFRAALMRLENSRATDALGLIVLFGGLYAFLWLTGVR